MLHSVCWKDYKQAHHGMMKGHQGVVKTSLPCRQEFKAPKGFNGRHSELPIGSNRGIKRAEGTQGLQWETLRGANRQQ